MLLINMRFALPASALFVALTSKSINCKPFESPDEIKSIFLNILFTVWPWRNPPYKLLKVKTPEGTLVSIEKLAGINMRPFHDWRKTVKLEVKRKIKDPKLAKAFQAHRTESSDDYYTFYQREDLEKAVSNSYGGTNGVTKKEKGESSDSP